MEVAMLFSSSPSVCHKWLYSLLIQHFKQEFLNTFHAFLFPYTYLHIVTVIVRHFDRTIIEEVCVLFHFG